jgi:hypothetical protein
LMVAFKHCPDAVLEIEAEIRRQTRG